MANGQGWQIALEALSPLDAQLDAALSAGDVESAIRLAFSGAQEAAALVGELGEDPATGRLHEVYVELTPLPLDAFEDGTLRDNGAYVSLAYRCQSLPVTGAGDRKTPMTWPADAC